MPVLAHQAGFRLRFPTSLWRLAASTRGLGSWLGQFLWWSLRRYPMALMHALAVWSVRRVTHTDTWVPCALVVWSARWEGAVCKMLRGDPVTQ